MDAITYTAARANLATTMDRVCNDHEALMITGVGKPEPLKHALSGFWSRRTTDEHRMVYRVVNSSLEIVQLRFHY